MSDAWKTDTEGWAQDYAARLATGLGRDGVAIGGSIARGQHWEHSDLEIAVLVEKKDPAVTHFSVDSDRGVETFQIERATIQDELAQVEGGNLTPVAGWPIQLWRCQVTHDPTGLLSWFAITFDQNLFDPQVVDVKMQAHQAALAAALAQARGLNANGQPRAALSLARVAMNECILILHWQLGVLPRSQNRVDSRLRALTRQHGLDDFYRLFRDVFDLDNAETAISRDWPICRDGVLALTELWEGAASREFFTTAVDSNFAWGENGGIICAYRMYVPIIGAPDNGILHSLDSLEWHRNNQPLVNFLGLQSASERTVSELIDRIAESASVTV